jgi:uncharacterized protein (TIGR02597 family)
VYFGPVPGYYTNRLDAGNALAITTPPLPDGIYYFSATAHDANGNESDFSNIVGTNIVTTFSPSGPIGLSNMTANADGSIAFIWGATPGANYTLQYKSNLLDAQWTTIGSSVAAAKSIFLSDTPAVPQRFYRLISGTTIGAPVGFLNLSLLGNSDNYISLPFARPGAITTSVASVSANVITPGGSPNWQPGQFVYASGTQSNTYYARFASGGAEGRIFRITNNSANTLSLDLGTDTNIDGINAGDSLSIEPYWTFASVFPNGNGVNASATIGNRSTEIIIPATTNAGMDLSAAKIYYVNAGVWKQVGQGNTNYNDDVLPPNSYFVVRHNVSTNTLLTTFGAVVTSKLAFSIRPGTTDKQDNPIGLMRPIPLSLDESGLIASGAFSPSLLPGSRTDELLTYDNTVASRNKSPSASYYYWNGAWRQVGAGINNVGPNRIFGAGAAIIIRKATNSAPVLWTSPANY